MYEFVPVYSYYVINFVALPLIVCASFIKFYNDWLKYLHIVYGYTIILVVSIVILSLDECKTLKGSAPRSSQ